MGWRIGGDWDRAAGVGMSGEDLPHICAEICAAVNHRAHWSQYSGGSASGTEYNFTYAPGHTAKYPTAAQFAGNPLESTIWQGVWTTAKTAIDAICGRFYTDNTFATHWTASALWSAAGTGLRAWDDEQPWWYVDNWLRIKTAVTLLRYYAVSGARNYDDDGDYGEYMPSLVYPSPYTYNIEDFADGCPTTGIAAGIGSPLPALGANFRFNLGSGIANGYAQWKYYSVGIAIPSYMGTLYGTYTTTFAASVTTSTDIYSGQGGGGFSPTWAFTVNGSGSVSAGMLDPGDVVHLAIDIDLNPHDTVRLASYDGPPDDQWTEAFCCTYIDWDSAAIYPVGASPGGMYSCQLRVDMASALADMS